MYTAEDMVQVDDDYTALLAEQINHVLQEANGSDKEPEMTGDSDKIHIEIVIENTDVNVKLL